MSTNPMSQRKTGRVVRILGDYGFVSCDALSGKDVYFKLSWFGGNPPLQVGDTVTFELKMLGNKPPAHYLSRDSGTMLERTPELEMATPKTRVEAQPQDLREVAFYYPGHLWRNSEWIKTLLLFFDGIGLLS